MRGSRKFSRGGGGGGGGGLYIVFLYKTHTRGNRGGPDPSLPPLDPCMGEVTWWSR